MHRVTLRGGKFIDEKVKIYFKPIQFFPFLKNVTSLIVLNFSRLHWLRPNKQRANKQRADRSQLLRLDRGLER